MLSIVGIGPGSKEDMTLKAIHAIEGADVVVGYKMYVDLIKDMLGHQEVISTGMKKERERCQAALEKAKENRKVVMISSGDPGVYAMAGLILEMVAKENLKISVNVIPGVTSANGAAALLGAPLMHDHVYISLSDLLTDYDLIMKRIALAAQGDFVLCLFNPKSKGRQEHILHARKILLEHKSKDTPVGIVNNVYRENQKIIHTNLEDMLNHEINMTTMVIIGNSHTFLYDDYMITPRGYQL